MQTAVRLSQSPSTAPQFQALVSWLALLVADTEKLVRAVQAHSAGASALVDQLEKDGDSFKFDQQGFVAYETKLFQPYEDRYTASMKAAGFKFVA